MNTHYWRSLEELAKTQEFVENSHREFLPMASEWVDPVSRRDFLRLMSASLALAGLNGCTRQPIEEIVPYVHEPERVVAGEPLFYATAMELNGFGSGLLVESREGRPIKVEGNPEHPISLGGTSAYHQASLLDLYDPDRSQAVMQAGAISSWEAFLSALNPLLEQQRSKQGAGLRILAEAFTSPTLLEQFESVLRKFPSAKWHQYEPVNRDAAYEGARLVLGEEVETQYDFEKAQIILSLDSDFLFSHPASLKFTRQLAAARRRRAGAGRMSRFYAAESSFTITGSMADSRLPVRSAEIGRLAWRLARQVTATPSNGPSSEADRWIQAVAEDLQKNKGASIVIAGEQQPAGVHALCHQLNEALGNIGSTVTYTAPVTPNSGRQVESLGQLVQEMNRGSVEVLILLGGNPVFTAPSDLRFAQALSKVNWRAHLSLYEDETSVLCHWHIPRTHFLESWSDTRAFDGTTSIVQPLIEPLYNGKTPHEILEAVIQQPARSAYEIVRDHWQPQKLWPDFEKGWRKALHDGFIGGTQSPVRGLRVQNGINPTPEQPAVEGLELCFRPDPSIWDGRFANNAWLQELPKPINKLVWDNAALISSGTANRYGLSNGHVVELEIGSRSLRLPVWIVPGQADNSITLTLGYGRTHSGRSGTGAGFNAYALRLSGAPWISTGLRIKKTGERYDLVSTQQQHLVQGRDVFRTLAHDEARNFPEPPSDDETLYDLNEFKNTAPAWGMVIDLNSCVGCNACAVACYAENNIPIVGKAQVARGRIMQWIRVDSYFSGSAGNPQVGHQPVPCMHCENAPCELVCPVAATVHDSEGLNLQVYNRCIGTRYCSNNCPYKVRRFNFLDYTDKKSPTLKMLRNPEVTVRSRGVMEKCTYCVQRIARARIQAGKEDRAIRDGEVIPACAQACPAEAITFGNIHDPKSKVSRLKAGPLNYGMLAELNTRPRTTYLPKITNPNLNKTA